MPVTISKALLQTSSTLIGLMVSMSMRAPTFLEIMSCIGMMNIELNIGFN